ncbi:hypothetical protein JTB14_029107 [Gonioctena quinquepunctata]|nr:hypothetical protein JTB14_029107 [Gonioctena quinquepunctata]
MLVRKGRGIESNHRPIFMTLWKPQLEVGEVEEDGSETGSKYCTRRIEAAVLNYMAMNNQLAQLPLFDVDSINEYIDVATKGLMNITDTTCRRHKPYQARTPWWSERLAILKTGIGRARRAYQDARRNDNPI